MLVARYPGLEQSSMGRAAGAWGPRRSLAFIVVSGALVWALIFWGASALR